MIRLLCSGVVLSCLAFVACGSDSNGTGSSSMPSCQSVCPGVLAAECAAGPVDQADCMSGCQTLQTGSCKDEYQALYTCAGANPKYACDGNQRPVVVGCETQAAAMYTCAAGGGPPPAGGLPPCSDVCNAVVAAQCPSGPPSESECVSGCETIRAGRCRAAYQTLFDCAGPSPTYQCNANGFVAVVGCESEDSALNSCLATGP